MAPQNASSSSDMTDTGLCFRVGWLWSGLFIICLFLGFPACVMVLRELLQRHRVSSDFYMFSLTIVDATYIVVNVFSLLNNYLWHSAPFECINNFMDGLSLCGRPLFMACICAECYSAVIHPIAYMTNRKNTMMRKITSVMVWLSTVCFSSLKCSVVGKYKYIFNTVPLFIALPVITFCDISVLQALKNPNPSGNTNIHPQKKQAFHVITNSFILTVIVYSPSVIIFLIANLTSEENTCVAETLGYSFSMIGSFILPILYLENVGKLDICKKWWRTHF